MPFSLNCVSEAGFTHETMLKKWDTFASSVCFWTSNLQTSHGFYSAPSLNYGVTIDYLGRTGLMETEVAFLGLHPSTTSVPKDWTVVWLLIENKWSLSEFPLVIFRNSDRIVRNLSTDEYTELELWIWHLLAPPAGLERRPWGAGRAQPPCLVQSRCRCPHRGQLNFQRPRPAPTLTPYVQPGSGRRLLPSTRRREPTHAHKQSSIQPQGPCSNPSFLLRNIW